MNNKSKNIENKEEKCKESTKSVNKYIHDIKNFRLCSEETLINMNNLPYEDRLKILVTYNEMIHYLNDYLELK
jgi:hypothetical protein